MRTTILAGFIFVQAALLLAAGSATLWWSQDLMRWLINMVGEERVLGASSVVHLEGGAKLLTNPAAMVHWMLPFWLLGAVQISAAITLAWLWAARRPERLPRWAPIAGSRPEIGEGRAR